MGAVTGALSTGLQLNAEIQAGQARVRSDLENQQLAQMRAADALQLGAIAAGRLRAKGSQVIGSERAGYGASGVDANVGTAAQVQAGTRATSELDALTAKNNAARAAWGLNLNARQFGQQAQVDQSNTNSQLEGAFLGGFGSAASSAAGGGTGSPLL